MTTQKLTPAQEVDKIKNGMQRSTQKIHQDFQILQPRLQPSNNNDNIKFIVLMLGMTGAGKTVIINLMAEKKLCKVKKNGDIIIALDANEPPLDNFRIGHDMHSETELPNFWYHSPSKTLFYDLGGFSDNKGACYDIANLYTIQKIFCKFQGVPIIPLLVVPEESLSKGSSFTKDVLPLLAKSFHNDIDRFGKACCLILTKQKDKDVHDVKDKLDAIINDLQLDLTPQARSLVQSICNQIEKKLAFFPQATNNPANFLVLGSNERQQVTDSILSCIKGTQPLLNISPILTVDPATKVYVGDLAKTIYADTTNLFTGSPQKLYEHCLQVPHVDAKSFREYLRKLKDQLHSLSSIANNDVNGFQKALKNVFCSYGMDDTYQRFSENLECLTYLGSVPHSFTYTINDWRAPCLAARDILGKVIKVDISPHGQDDLKIQGYFLDIGDVVNAINQRSRPNIVYVNSLHTFWFNQDLQSRGTCDTPGISFSLVAPIWKVVGSTINLSGRDGANGVNGINSGESGTSGKSGGNGAYFYGKGKKFHNMDKLVVLTNGGNGGNGGNGVQGSNGYQGTNAPLSGAPTLGPTSYVSGVSTEKYTTGSDWHWEGLRRDLYYHLTGTNGGPGQNGGNAGRAGIAGSKGTAQIEGYAQWSHRSQDGQDGQNGKPGEGGTGGIHGMNAYGHSAREWMTQNWSKGKPLGGQSEESVPIRTITPITHQGYRGQADNGKPGTVLNDVARAPATEQISQNSVNVIYSTYDTEARQGIPNTFLIGK